MQRKPERHRWQLQDLEDFLAEIETLPRAELDGLRRQIQAVILRCQIADTRAAALVAHHAKKNSLQWISRSSAAASRKQKMASAPASNAPERVLYVIGVDPASAREMLRGLIANDEAPGPMAAWLDDPNLEILMVQEEPIAFGAPQVHLRATGQGPRRSRGLPASAGLCGVEGCRGSKSQEIRRGPSTAPT